MNILVTGGAGFIGSNLLLYLHDKYPEYQFLNIDKLSYASDLNYLDEISGSDRYEFRKIDITDRDKVRETIRDFQPEGVFHLAAESHVDNSIKGPEPFILSNVVGTFNLIEECRQLWQEDEKAWQNRFLHVSTDEVYGTLGDEGYFTEETPYAPNSPYSASKAGSDFIVRSYYHTYGMNVVTTNCSNNFGPHQHDEKLIPTVIRNAVQHNDIPVYGKGENVRDWLYVVNHCDALDLVFHEGRLGGETYNVGGDNEWQNLELVHLICDLLNEEVGEGPEDDYKNLVSFVTDRPGHDYRYAIDASKIKSELGWSQEGSFEEDLRKTVRWYIERYKEHG